MENFPKITQVTPLAQHRLLIVFANGKIKEYNCSLLLQRPEFFLLKNEAFFKSVTVDRGGYGISWNDDVDLSEYELWTNGVETTVQMQNSI